MEIDGDNRHPFAQHFDAALGLGLGGGEPVAVQVEVVMVGATAGPGLGVFGGKLAGVGFQAEILFVEVDEAVAAIGVLGGVQQQDVVAQNLLHHGVILGGD